MLLLVHSPLLVKMFFTWSITWILTWFNRNSIFSKKKWLLLLLFSWQFLFTWHLSIFQAEKRNCFSALWSRSWIVPFKKQSNLQSILFTFTNFNTRVIHKFLASQVPRITPLFYWGWPLPLKESGIENGDGIGDDLTRYFLHMMI